MSFFKIHNKTTKNDGELIVLYVLWYGTKQSKSKNM